MTRGVATAEPQPRSVNGSSVTMNKGVAVVYCRVSTKNQEEEGTSLESQAEACIKHAESLGYTVGRVTKEVFTGAELWDRPLLARDRADIKRGKYQALIAYSIDRLSRDPVHLAIVAEECSRVGADLQFASEKLDGSPEGVLIQFVKGYAARTEREKIRERSIRGKHQRLLTGKFPRAGTDLYGYRRVDDATRREINEAEALVVRKIFEWFVNDRVSLRQIERRLNDERVPPPATGKRRSSFGTEESGQKWNHTAIRHILEEPGYKGETIFWRWKSVDGRMIRRPENEWVRLPEGTTPEVVTKEVWDAAQTLIGENKGRSIAVRNEYRPILLRGLIYCAVCDRPMRPHMREGRKVTYRCSSREHGGSPCGAKPVPADDVIPACARARDAAGHFMPIDSNAVPETEMQQGVETWTWDRVAAVLRDPQIIVSQLDRQAEKGSDPGVSSELQTAHGSMTTQEKRAVHDRNVLKKPPLPKKTGALS
jgi:site-specific DNA recombinase